MHHDPGCARSPAVARAGSPHHPPEVGRPTQPMALRQHGGSRPRAQPAVSGRQLLAALAATRSDDAATGAGPHP